MEMVASEEGVCPSRRVFERGVVEDRRPFQHLFRFVVVLEFVVCTCPDAVLVIQLADAVMRSAARPVAAILRARVPRTQKSAVRQTAVAAIFAAVHDELG